MDFSFIFIGSTHGFIDDFNKQQEVIISVNPDFVLCENLEDLSLDSKEKFVNLFKKKEVSNMTPFNEVERLVELCNNKDIKLIGIDLHNFGFDKELQEKIKNKRALSHEEEDKVEKIVGLRDKLHLSKILEYKNKTKNRL